MTRRRTWWLAYGAGALVMLAALAWISAAALRVERSEQSARAEAARLDGIRLALWRMDSWLTPRLLREASRPVSDYRTMRDPPPNEKAPAAVPADTTVASAPSPLVAASSELFPLYFEVGALGQLTSPQVPAQSAEVVLAMAHLTEVQLKSNRERLDALRDVLAEADLITIAANAEQCLAQVIADPAGDTATPPTPPDTDPPRQVRLAQAQQLDAELTKRQAAYVLNVVDPAQQFEVGAPAPGDEAAQVGPLVAVWAVPPAGSSPGSLLFLRRVTTPTTERFQGFVCDWPTLRQSLLNEVADLLPGADLVAVPDVGAADVIPTMLATAPVALVVPAGPSLAAAGLTPLQTTLAVAWLAVLAGLGAVAITLRATVAFAEKRSRFASAVTHELRTPLTTFRLYTEMLTDDMVRDESQRRSYLQTLHDESKRLSTLVENVIAYARLEEGRGRSRPRPMTIAALLDEILPPILRRAEDAGAALEVDTGHLDGEMVEVDAEAIGQILFNLVDNACKYGRSGESSRIELTMARSDGRLCLTVRDHGPGVPTRLACRVFAPFERAGQDGGDERGLGLGLTLSRGLARDLGGDLECQSPADRGACFVLSVPLRPRA